MKNDCKDMYNILKDKGFWISKESCDTENWSNDSPKFCFSMPELLNILKYIDILNRRLGLTFSNGK